VVSFLYLVTFLERVLSMAQNIAPRTRRLVAPVEAALDIISSVKEALQAERNREVDNQGGQSTEEDAVSRDLRKRARRIVEVLGTLGTSALF